MIIDCHCHYNLSPLFEEWEKHWENASAKDIGGAVVIGVNRETSLRAVTLSQHPQFWAAAGIHPNEPEEMQHNQPTLSWADIEKQQLEEFEKLHADVHEKDIVAVGECGLDYFRIAEHPLREEIIKTQKKLVTAQIKWAQQLRKPLILHARDTGEQAYWDMLAALQNAAWKDTFILHCVSGPSEYVQKALSQGAYVGVAGNVTYKNAAHIRELAEFIPREKMLIETDAPFLPPHPHRGKMCEPWMIRETATFLENLLNIDDAQLLQNTSHAFDISL